jgi:hypothetical protein
MVMTRDVQGGLMNGLFRVGHAQTEFVWKLVDLYGRRTDRRNSAFMRGGCTMIETWVDVSLMGSILYEGVVAEGHCRSLEPC